jgi:hypothetical protein
MARTKADLRAHLRDLAPWWLREPEEVQDAFLEAVAAVIERIEAAGQTLHDRTFIALADGAWLDAHGRERVIARLAGELDEDYRPRLLSIEDQVTALAIKAAVDGILLVGACRVEEHTPDGAYATDTGSGSVQSFADLALAFDGARAFTVFIAEQLPSENDTAFGIQNGAGTTPQSFAVESTGAGSWPNDPGAFADQTAPTQGDIYARIWDVVNRLRPAGSSFQVVVE